MIKNFPWATTINRDNDHGIGTSLTIPCEYQRYFWLEVCRPVSNIELILATTFYLYYLPYSQKRFNVGINGREKVINISSRKNSILPLLWRTLYPQNQNVFSKESEILWTIILIERFQWKKIVIEVAFQRPMDYNSFDIFFSSIRMSEIAVSIIG